MAAFQLKGPFFVFDVESIGLHGEGYAVAGGLFGWDGPPLWEFSYACSPDRAEGNAAGRIWVSQNVPSIAITHETPKEVRNGFWKKWLEAREAQAAPLVYCGWPVEAHFLSQCVEDSPEVRTWEAPYPLHELASLLAASGHAPLGHDERLDGERPEHHPMSDVRQVSRLLRLCREKK